MIGEKMVRRKMAKSPASGTLHRTSQPLQSRQDAAAPAQRVVPRCQCDDRLRPAPPTRSLKTTSCTPGRPIETYSHASH